METKKTINVTQEIIRNETINDFKKESLSDDALAQEMNRLSEVAQQQKSEDINPSLETKKAAKEEKTETIPVKLRSLQEWREKISEEVPFDEKYEPLNIGYGSFDEIAEALEGKFSEYGNRFRSREGKKSNSFMNMENGMYAVSSVLSDIRKLRDRKGGIHEDKVKELYDCNQLLNAKFVEAEKAIDDYISSHGGFSFKAIFSEGRARLKLAREVKKMLKYEGNKYTGVLITRAMDSVTFLEENHESDYSISKRRRIAEKEAEEEILSQNPELKEQVKNARKRQENRQWYSNEYSNKINKNNKLFSGASETYNRNFSKVLNVTNVTKEKVYANIEFLEAFQNDNKEQMRAYAEQIINKLVSVSVKREDYVGNSENFQTNAGWFFMYAELKHQEVFKELAEENNRWKKKFEIVDKKADIINALNNIEDAEIGYRGFDASGAYSTKLLNQTGAYESIKMGYNTAYDAYMDELANMKNGLEEDEKFLAPFLQGGTSGELVLEKVGKEYKPEYEAKVKEYYNYKPIPFEEYSQREDDASAFDRNGTNKLLSSLGVSRFRIFNGERTEDYAREIRKIDKAKSKVTAGYTDNDMDQAHRKTQSNITTRALIHFLNAEPDDLQKTKADIEMLEAFKNGDAEMIERYVTQIINNFLDLSVNFSDYYDEHNFLKTFRINEMCLIWDGFSKDEMIKPVLEKMDKNLIDIVDKKAAIINSIGNIMEINLTSRGYQHGIPCKGKIDDNTAITYIKAMTENLINQNNEFQDLKDNLKKDPQYNEKYKMYFEKERLFVPELKNERKENEPVNPMVEINVQALMRKSEGSGVKLNG